MFGITNRLVNQKNGVPGLGKVPIPRSRDNGAATMLFLAFVVVASFAATEFVAWRLGFRVPMFDRFHQMYVEVDSPGHVYAPWMVYVWYAVLDSGSHYKVLSGAQRGVMDGLFYQAMGVLFGTLCVGLFLARPLVRFRVPQVLADSEFATDAEIRKWGYTGGKGIVLGRRTMYDRGVPKTEIIRANGEGHALFALGTGAGKGRAHITTSILSDEWADDTIVLNDPPDEQWDRVSRALREDLGHYVFRCAWGKDRDKFPDVAPWNCWKEIPRGDKRDSMVVALLAQKHVDRDGTGVKGRNRYFYEGGINIAQLAGLTAAYAQGSQYGIRCSGAGILDFVNTVVRDGDGLTGLVDFALNFDHTAGGQFSFVGPDGKRSNKHPTIVRLAGLVSQIKGEEAAPVIATFQQGFSIYSHAIIAENTEDSGFSVSRVMDYDFPCFISVSGDSGDEDTLDPLHSCFYELLLAFNQSSKFLKMENGRQVCTHQHEMWVIIDEAFSRGKIRGIEKGATTARKFKIHLNPFYQTATQNTALYGENNSVEGLMAMKSFSGAGEKGAQEKISGYVGSHTIGYDTVNIGERGGHSYSMHLNSSPLLKQDQVGRIDMSRYRLCVPLGRKPFVVEAANYDEYPHLARRAAMGAYPLSDCLPLAEDTAKEQAAEDPLQAEFADVLGVQGSAA